MEFQAVILAGSTGKSTFYPITSDGGISKSLLPVCNRPLLQWQLDMLKSAGFAEVIVITRPSLAKHVQYFVDCWKRGRTDEGILPSLTSPTSIQSSPAHHSLTQPSPSHMPAHSPMSTPSTGSGSYLQQRFDIDLAVIDYAGTADALRQIRDRVKTDFFVLSGDLVSNIQLHYLADIHRSRDSSLVALVQERTEQKDKKTEKDKTTEENLDSQYIGLDEKTGRLVYFQSQADVEDGLAINKSLLRRHPNLTMYTRLKDAHLYLFAHWVIDLLCEMRMINDIQSELVPLMVKRQFSSNWLKWRARNKSNSQALALLMSHAPSYSSSSAYNASASAASPAFEEDEAFRCYVYTAPPACFCQRANSMSAWKNMNHELAADPEYTYTPWALMASDNQATHMARMFPKAQLGGQVHVAKSVTLGDYVNIKRSTVGYNCKIGNSVKLINCIVMENVTVEDGCTLQDCILSPGCTVQKNCSLKDCKIGPNFTVSAASKQSVQLKSCAFWFCSLFAIARGLLPLHLFTWFVLGCFCCRLLVFTAECKNETLVQEDDDM